MQYFGTDGIRGAVGSTPITAEFFLKLGWALGRVLLPKGCGRVLIGKDTRTSGYMLESALEAGLSAAGVDSMLSGPLPTPAVAYLTRELAYDAGLVISASHNVHSDNGIKFFMDDGFKLSTAIEQAIEQTLTLPLQTVNAAELGKATRLDDASRYYIDFCKRVVEPDINFSALKLVIDCAHGAGYYVAPRVFRGLGAQVVVIGDTPNGTNINAQCGSTAPQLLQQRVVAEQADLGIALDGDGDRVILVDHAGALIDGDQILYAIVQSYCQQRRLQGGVVGTVMSNMGLQRAFEAQGLDFVRTRVGDRHVLEELRQRDWLLGGETSGHIICLDRTTTGDGIISALQVISAMVQSQLSLCELVAGFEKMPQVMRNLRVAEGCDPTTAMQVKRAVQQVESELGQRGRVVLRRSGTEPVVRVMVEGEREQEVAQLADDLAAVVAEVGHVERVNEAAQSSVVAESSVAG